MQAQCGRSASSGIATAVTAKRDDDEELAEDLHSAGCTRECNTAVLMRHEASVRRILWTLQVASTASAALVPDTPLVQHHAVSR